MDKAISDHLTHFDEGAIRDRDLAQQTLVDVLINPKATLSEKIRAATVLQNQWNKSTELGELSKRMKKLEDKIDIWKDFQDNLAD